MYYSILKSLWHELDMFYDLEWSSTVNSAWFKKMLEKEIIFEFLTGLNKELDEIFGPFFFFRQKEDMY